MSTYIAVNNILVHCDVLLKEHVAQKFTFAENVTSGHPKVSSLEQIKQYYG